MSQKALSNWLKAIVIGMGLFGLVLFIWVCPMLLQEMIQVYPERASWYVPWIILMCVLAVPCYAVLGFSWLISVNIGRDKSFSKANANHLKMISLMAMLDAAILLVTSTVFLFLNMNHPSFFLGSLLIVFVGVAVAVMAAGLSHLVLKAAVLQEESDLTI